MAKVRRRCRTYTQMAKCAVKKRGERKGVGVGHEKKQMSEGNEEGEMENKRGHWRQIKDTQLND